ncbi:MAG: hypothetical protein GY765_35760 [bacterium]|nr:hypothetical protein [bacterium]
MILRIEHELSKSICHKGCHISIPAKEAESRAIHILTLEMKKQELEQWCWASIAVAVGKYYGTGSYRQNDIATEVLGFDCSGYDKDEDLKARCDQTRTMDEALETVDCFSHWTPGKPSFERLQTELRDGRPICIRIEWFDGGAHYAGITGCNAYNRDIYIDDPKHGFSKHPYESFPHNYRKDGGVWTENFWTDTKGVSTHNFVNLL